MKLEPVTKVESKICNVKKKLTVMSCQQIVSSMANFEQSRSQILDTWSVKLTFSLTVTFYLTKTENKTKSL